MEIVDQIKSGEVALRDFHVPCEVCGERRATQRHHRLSRRFRAVYGKLIDDPRNQQLACTECHQARRVECWTEKQFCKALEIEPMGKLAELKKMKEEICNEGI